MLKIVETTVEGKLPATLDDLAREGARWMLAKALEAEVSEYVERHRAERGEDGRALVMRNGHARARQVTTGTGTVEVQAPRADDRGLGREVPVIQTTGPVWPSPAAASAACCTRSCTPIAARTQRRRSSSSHSETSVPKASISNRRGPSRPSCSP